MTIAARHPGLILGAARFFHDPRGSMRGVLDSRPGEGRLFAYALTAAGMLLAGRMIALGAARGVDPGEAAAQVASLLFFVPLFYYGLAALGTVLARAFGGRGGWRDGRAAFFWAALVSAPVMALTGLAALALEDAPLPLVALLGQVGPAFFGWALALCFAEAFGFARAWTVFAVIAALVMSLVAVLWWAGA